MTWQLITPMSKENGHFTLLSKLEWAYFPPMMVLNERPGCCDPWPEAGRRLLSVIPQLGHPNNSWNTAPAYRLCGFVTGGILHLSRSQTKPFTVSLDRHGSTGRGRFLRPCSSWGVARVR